MVVVAIRSVHVVLVIVPGPATQDTTAYHREPRWPKPAMRLSHNEWLDSKLTKNKIFLPLTRQSKSRCSGEDGGRPHHSKPDAAATELGMAAAATRSVHAELAIVPGPATPDTTARPGYRVFASIDW